MNAAPTTREIKRSHQWVASRARSPLRMKCVHCGREKIEGVPLVCYVEVVPIEAE